MSEESVSDEDLMCQYAAGDASAFERLYHRHKAALYRYVQHQCFNGSRVDEIYQDVWLKLIVARQRYHRSARFQTFLYHIAHNLLVDYFRRSKTRQVVSERPLENLSIVETAWAPKTSRPDVEVARQQELSTLFELIEKLPDVQREVFVLREETGMSLEGIARVTGVGRETAKSRLRYAIKTLREGLR